MKAVVEKNGVLIPRELLGNAREVEIVRSGHQIVIELTPAPDSARVSEETPSIWALGEIVADGGAADGSTHHDRYVSGV
jgi:hypothetical protein